MALPVSAQQPYPAEGTEEKPVLRDVLTESDGDTYRIIKFYDAPPDYSPALLAEEDFEKQGVLYTAGDIIQIRENHAEERKLASQTVSLSHEEKETPVLSPLLDYSMDGFSGQLRLDMDSISTVPTGEKRYAYTVSDTQEIAGLARNDTYSIPKSMMKNGVSLSLADVSWTDLGTSYTATATYTGTAYGKRASGYTTTAIYMGEVSRDTLESVTWKVIYEGTPVSPAPGSRSEGASPLLILCAVLIPILLTGGVLLYLFVFKKGKRKYAGEDEEDEV